MSGDAMQCYELFAESQLDRDLWREKMEKLGAEITGLENARRSFTMDHDLLVSRACDLIDELRDRPETFLTAGDPMQKAQALDVLAENVVILDGQAGPTAARIDWKLPFSFLMRPALLDLRKDYDLGGLPAPSGDLRGPETQKTRGKLATTATGESSSLFQIAPDIEQFQNFLPPVIPDTLLEIRLHYAALDAKEA